MGDFEIVPDPRSPEQCVCIKGIDGVQWEWTGIDKGRLPLLMKAIATYIRRNESLCKACKWHPCECEKIVAAPPGSTVFVFDTARPGFWVCGHCGKPVESCQCTDLPTPV